MPLGAVYDSVHMYEKVNTLYYIIETTFFIQMYIVLFVEMYTWEREKGNVYINISTFSLPDVHFS